MQGYCVRPLQSSYLFLRVWKKWLSGKTRNLSYALPSSKESMAMQGPDHVLESDRNEELLQSLASGQDLDEMEATKDQKLMKDFSFNEYWQKRNEVPIPVRNDAEEDSCFIPEILIEQKSVPQILWHDTLNENEEYWQNKKKQQLELEQSFLDEALLEYRKHSAKAREREMGAVISSTKHLVAKWIPPLTDAIKSEQQKILTDHNRRGCMQANHLITLLEAQELAVLTIHTVLGLLLKGDMEHSRSGHCTFTQVVTRLGKAVKAQINLLKLKQRVESENQRRKRLNKYINLLKGHEIEKTSPSIKRLTPWEQNLIERSVKMETKVRILKNRWTKKGVTFKDVVSSQWRLGKEQADWSESTTVKLGAHLVDIMTRSMLVRVDKATGKIMGKEARTVSVVEPALKHEVVWTRLSIKEQKPKRMGFLSIHPSVLQLVESDGAHSMFARSYPMVYPPMEWQSFHNGGYFTIPCKVMRSYETMDPIRMIREADKKRSLNQVYDALTILGRTPWRMNKEVFEVVEEVWNQGGGQLELPSGENVPLPDEKAERFRLCADSGALHLTFGGETDIEVKYRNAEIYRIKKKNKELHSLRCDVELKLASARKFLNEDRIYFPHNVDFRGRAYPIPPHLNHLGNDLCRGLLLFAEGRALGSNGLRWLYIQIANLYGSGENKKSIEKRYEFGFKNLDKIIDSAENPLEGLQWWMGADSPWQFLATCMDIRHALRSGNPEQYVSHMHVHQDGSCNGLQHYAALGQDAVGAAAVNLRDVDSLSDVYSEIALVVAKLVHEDAIKGHRWARILDGHVDRKLVKQTVMTSVYGVTFVGAREQISNRLKERGWEDNSDLFHVSFYAARVTMTGLHKMFKSAKDVMHWLSSCAEAIAAVDKTVMWTTPLGLPIAQPYRQAESRSIRTVLQDVSLPSLHINLPVMKRRQRTAFPPNYVHSLDSTHMMMTALGCHQHGITFAGVHDSFWTHASSVDMMNRILREKFFELHSKPLLKELRAQFQETYKDQVESFPELPPVGDFDLKEIFNAKYFFN